MESLEYHGDRLTRSNSTELTDGVRIGAVLDYHSAPDLYSPTELVIERVAKLSLDDQPTGSESSPRTRRSPLSRSKKPRASAPERPELERRDSFWRKRKASITGSKRSTSTSDDDHGVVRKGLTDKDTLSLSIQFYLTLPDKLAASRKTTLRLSDQGRVEIWKKTRSASSERQQQAFLKVTGDIIKYLGMCSIMECREAPVNQILLSEAFQEVTEKLPAMAQAVQEAIVLQNRVASRWNPLVEVANPSLERDRLSTAIDNFTATIPDASGYSAEELVQVYLVNRQLCPRDQLQAYDHRIALVLSKLPPQMLPIECVRKLILKNHDNVELNPGASEIAYWVLARALDQLGPELAFREDALPQRVIQVLKEWFPVRCWLKELVGRDFTRKTKEGDKALQDSLGRSDLFTATVEYKEVTSQFVRQAAVLLLTRLKESLSTRAKVNVRPIPELWKHLIVRLNQPAIEPSPAASIEEPASEDQSPCRSVESQQDSETSSEESPSVYPHGMRVVQPQMSWSGSEPASEADDSESEDENPLLPKLVSPSIGFKTLFLRLICPEIIQLDRESRIGKATARFLLQLSNGRYFHESESDHYLNVTLAEEGIARLVTETDRRMMPRD